jgi:uncharacterized coiled-coil DUF342 family protein
MADYYTEQFNTMSTEIRDLKEELAKQKSETINADIRHQNACERAYKERQSAATGMWSAERKREALRAENAKLRAEVEEIRSRGLVLYGDLQTILKAYDAQRKQLHSYKKGYERLKAAARTSPLSPA